MWPVLRKAHTMRKRAKAERVGGNLFEKSRWQLKNDGGLMGCIGRDRVDGSLSVCILQSKPTRSNDQ